MTDDLIKRLSDFRLAWQESGDLTYLGAALVDAIVEIERGRAAPAVAWQREHPTQGWTHVDETDIAHYAEQGQRVRALGVIGLVSPQGRK